MSALALFQRAELAYSTQDIHGALDGYVASVLKVVKNEDVTQALPVAAAMLPNGTPYELLLMVWRNLNGFLRDPKLGLNADNSPAAYKLLLSYRPPILASGAADESKSKTIDDYPKFKRRGARGALILDTMRITAALTLGLMAWDKRDRATAARRYEEGLALAEKYEATLSTKPTRGLEGWLAVDVAEMRHNLAVLVRNDQAHAAVADSSAHRREKVTTTDDGQVGLTTWRVEGNGEISVEVGHTFATDVCANCDKRGVKLLKCSGCKRITYCGRECQVAHWKQHKGPCKASRTEEGTA